MDKRILLLLLAALLVFAACTTPERIDDPTVSPESGEYTGSVTVTMMSPSGAQIYYTVDGSAPDQDSMVYTESFELKSNTVVKAVSYKDGMILPSNVIERTYIVVG